VVLERRKFGSQGWNIPYPFNTGDLTISVMVLNNYLENYNKIPWEDLRYIFGEIMYGGHISDDWDRRLCNTYLRELIKEDLLEGMELFPGFTCPTNLNHKDMLQYVAEQLPHEGPAAFGLHSNAEIGFRSSQSEKMFVTILDMQPRASGGGAGLSLQEKVKVLLDEMMEKLPDNFDLVDLGDKLESRGPYQIVFLQEAERLNILLSEIRRSLTELDLGLKGDLTITDRMEALMSELFVDRVPVSWERIAYPSLKPLAAWTVNLLKRHKQIFDWTESLQLPKVLWLPGLFNPQSFLTAIMQTMARKNEWPLDKMTLLTDVMKKMVEEFDQSSRDGAFVYGMYLEGARWDTQSAQLEESRLKELYPMLPVILIKPVPLEQAEKQEVYMCPVYKTQRRGPTYVFTAGLKTKLSASRWVLGGVAMLLDVVEL